MTTPEQHAREQIDALLMAAGWSVQDYTAYAPGAAAGIALREVPLQSGRCDYLLIVDRRPVGVIEAKRAGTLLAGVAEQSAHYAASLPAFFKIHADELPFAYESTGTETFFRDQCPAILRLAKRHRRGHCTFARQPARTCQQGRARLARGNGPLSWCQRTDRLN